MHWGIANFNLLYSDTANISKECSNGYFAIIS